ncbi:hypothetical protein E2C01_101439 [Portunus trituberculatus]|uniref:Uncharacterized protein n=1 Tax=Portunus trituberculatus TaxID=210409 RepID=A0A5B7K9L6_PORTR|nr:hypothetical protein [Portunus trituberculatus]
MQSPSTPPTSQPSPCRLLAESTVTSNNVGHHLWK